MSTLPAGTPSPSGGGGGDNVVTDRELFDHALSDTPSPSPSPAPASTPSPAPAPTQQPTGQPTAQPGQQPRAPDGRFAPQGQPQPQQRQQPEDHRVPLRELLEERERRQQIEAEHRQALAHIRSREQQQQPPQGPETIFDGPDEYLNHRVMNPLRQEGYTMMLQIKDGISREMANQHHSKAVVDAALADMLKVRNTPQGNFEFNQIMSSGHPYGELVKWHVRQKAQAAIGNDPQAWLRQQQQAWFNDPRVRAMMIESIRAGGGGQQPQQQQGNGRAPLVNLPPSLSTVPATSGREGEQGDLSSESLFAHAIRS